MSVLVDSVSEKHELTDGHEVEAVPIRSDKPARAVVIGSGFGGLAAAIRLGSRGYDVTVLERLDAPGGRAYVHRQDGFTFDAGPTIVTVPFVFEELWALCGKRMDDHVKLKSLSPFYRIRFDDGTHFDYSGDQAAMECEIARFNPEDIAGFKRLLAVSERTYKIGFEGLVAVSFHSFWTMIKILPDLISTQFHRSVYGLVSRYIKHSKLRMVFSFHPLLVGGNPFTTTAVYALIAHLERRYGVHYAMGGTGSLVTGMVDLIKGQGGRIRYHCDVEEIVVEQGRAVGVRLASGEVLHANIIVSNADSAATYRDLLPARYRKRWTNWRLRKSSYSMSLFVWYFGTDRQYEHVPHHMILLSKRYRSLLEDIFAKNTLADDFSLYLHRPTATDSSLAPEGCDAFYVLAPVPHLDADVDWTTQAEPYRRAVEQALEESVLPQLSSHVVSSRLLTPVDFKTRYRSVKGAAFGLQPVLWQTGWFRPHNRSEDVENLFLVGAGTHPGAGLPGVVSSAKVLDEVVPDAGAWLGR